MVPKITKLIVSMVHDDAIQVLKYRAFPLLPFALAVLVVAAKAVDTGASWDFPGRSSNHRGLPDYPVDELEADG